MKRSSNLLADTNPIDFFTKNGSSGRWRLAKGVVVALTYAGFYYAGRVVINRVVSREPFLLDVRVLEVSDSLEMIILYPTGDLNLLSQCGGRNIVWEEEFVRPIIDEESIVSKRIGCQSTFNKIDEKPIDQFLTLTVNMEVALLHGDRCDNNFVGVGVIEECSPKGSWEGFRVPHSFFVIVRLKTVNKDFMGLVLYCKTSKMDSLGNCLGFRILWSGYKVQPLGLFTLEVVRIGHQPTHPCLKKVKVEDVALVVNYDSPTNDCCGSSVNAQAEIGHAECLRSDDVGSKTTAHVGSSDKLHDNAASIEFVHSGPVPQCVGPKSTFDSDCNRISASISADSDDSNPESTLPYPDRPHWRNKYCELLNEDFSLFERAMIQVCLPNEACDENVLGDTDVGVMFVSEHESLQMMTMRWPFLRTNSREVDFYLKL